MTRLVNGIIPKYVMHDQNLTLQSKAIYAYFSSFAGNSGKNFPFIKTILRHLGITKTTYYRHYNPLLENGYISVERGPNKESANIYTLIQEPEKLCGKSLKDYGYGTLSRSIMSDKSLSIKAKGLYAYFCANCEDKEYVSLKNVDILSHLNISGPTYNKALNQLRESGYINTDQQRENGKLSNNIYRII